MDDCLRPAIEATYEATPARAQQEVVPIPIEFGPPNAEANAVVEYGKSLLAQGVSLVRTGHFVEGEDLIYRAAVCAFYANSNPLRATSYLYLGKCAETIHDLSQCLAFYRWEKDLALRIGWDEVASAADERIKSLENLAGKVTPNEKWPELFW